ncbi:hypothetical protein EII38_03710 [Streptococcus minor]|uniref:Uncharacterized protein n=1 Tax=Streptococcus minor TaxID=229549 RepID=A0A3P1VDV5_9STRE|nr:hypothetical protein [Streptococcus minor]MDO5078160.1 hypothetical protein [Streptococcus minor]RRD31867.1 hypothetical protein EII38_03710 [Streptococcus minor]
MVNKSASFKLTTYFDTPPDKVSKLVKNVATLYFVSSPLLIFRPVKGQELSHQWTNGTYWFHLYLFGFIPLGKQAIVISFPKSPVFQILDDGHSQFIKQWRHMITIKKEGQGTLYEDQLQISAGAFTYLVIVFAQLFYKHRQRRWKKLLEYK